MAELFIHSSCCNAHWELVCRETIYSLECEKCGKDIGPQIKVEGPNLDGCRCKDCEKGGTG